MIYIKRKMIIVCFIGLIILISLIGVYLSIKQNRQLEFEDMEDVQGEIFTEYYEKANETLQNLSIDEKIGQLFLVRLPEENAVEELEKYKFGGYLLFEKDFKEKTEQEVKDMLQELQNASNIPLLIAVDEEGGKVIRVSSNKNLVSDEFKSPSEIYELGGFDLIRKDTIEKSNILSNLGINLNLAPVVDVSTNPEDYIYQRTLGEDTELTSIYAKTVIEASKETKVSYTLKHFPGYGNNVDTHTESSVDNKTYQEIFEQDIPPFLAGIEAGAEAVMISHNIVTSIDGNNPASLSSKINEILRQKLGFTGVIITDSLDMEAISNESDAAVRAVLAGNNLMIATDYESSIRKVKEAFEEGSITEEEINELVLRNIAWKYYKGMMQ